MVNRTSFLAICLLVLNACAYWPPEGQGGQAESFETEPAYWSDIRKSNKALIECFDRRLQSKSLNEVRKRHPAKLIDLSIQWTRAMRAHGAHLDLEAQHDLVKLDEDYRRFIKFLKRQSHFQLVSLSLIEEENCP